MFYIVMYILSDAFFMPQIAALDKKRMRGNLIEAHKTLLDQKRVEIDRNRSRSRTIGALVRKVSNSRERRTLEPSVLTLDSRELVTVRGGHRLPL
jgi:hypothetical protein